MKKLLLSITALSFCLNAVSQNRVQGVQVPLTVPAPSKKWIAPVTGDEIPLAATNQTTAPVQNKNGNPSIASSTLGTTTYDLQSNGSSCNRIYSKSVGVAGTWTFSQSNDLAAADRGTGYNFNADPTDVVGWGSQPTSRVETDRRGWPEIDYSEVGGFEAFVSHNGSVPGGCKLVKRSPAGSGAWTESPLPKADDDSSIIFIWPRMRIGGNNGITIHEIDLSLPVANPPGVIYHGMDGVLTYSRSLDGGATWDIRHMLLPDEDVTLFSGMNGDGYSIDSYGDVVAITYGGFTDDWCMWKSLDNGTTWTRTVIRQFALPGFNSATIGEISDSSGDGIPDTLICTDGYNAILIDNNGLIHCWTSTMRMIDDGVDNLLNYFPGENSLLYWNESMGAMPANFPVVGFCQDFDNNGVLDIQAATPGTYQSGLATMPTAGVDAANNIYLAYAAPVEPTTNGVDQSYWQIFVKASTDGGITWSADTNIINDPFTEAVFPSMARNVSSCIPILWQQDSEPGLAVRGDMDPFVTNNIEYLCVDYIPGVNVSVPSIPAPASMMTVYPNPASDYVKLNYTFEQSEFVTINVTNVLGQSVYHNASKMVSGSNSVTVNLKNFNSGVYSVNTTVGEKTYSSKFVVE